MGSTSRQGTVAFHPTRHALLRYQEHYPTHTIGDLTLAAGTGELISVEMAAALLGRPVTPGMVCTRYVLHPKGTGLFVLVRAGERAFALVTYLRFGPAQQAIASAGREGTRDAEVRERLRTPVRRLVRPPQVGCASARAAAAPRVGR